jgi:SET domain/CXC domain
MSQHASRPALRDTKYETRPGISDRLGAGRSLHSTAFTGNGTFQTPLSLIFNPSRHSSASIPDKQLAGRTSSSPRFESSSSRSSLPSMRRRPSSQHTTSGLASPNPGQVIDLTSEDTSREPQMVANPHNSIGPPQRGYRSSQQQIYSVNQGNHAPQSLSRMNSPHLANNPNSLPANKYSQMDACANQPDRASNGMADRGQSSDSRNGGNRSPDSSSRLCRTGRTIPWSSEEHAAASKIPGLFSSSLIMDASRRDFTNGRSRSAGNASSTTPDRGQSNPMVGLLGNPKAAQRRSSPSQTLHATSHPRLKLNGPKRYDSHKLDLLPPGYTNSEARGLKSPHTNKPAVNTSSRISERGHKKSMGALSSDGEQTSTTDSDSDDASVRMQRSIYQATAMYSEEPQTRDPHKHLPVDHGIEDVPKQKDEEYQAKSVIRTPANDLGSAELGGCPVAAQHNDNTNHVSQTKSESEKEDRDLPIQSERLSAPENGLQTLDLQVSTFDDHTLSSDDFSNDVAVVDENQEPKIAQGLAHRSISTSNKESSVSPDVKLLESIFKLLVEEMQEDQDYLISGFLSRARKCAAQFSGPDIDESLPDPFAAAPANSKVRPSPFNPNRRVRLESRVTNARSKLPPIEVQAIAFKSEAQRLPKYNSIVRLGLNVLAPNDKELRYLPYFPSEEEKDGADAAHHKRREELLEGFDNRIKFLPEERKCAEQAEFWREHAEYFLEEVGCTCTDVMYYLLHDEDSEWKPDCQLSIEALAKWQQRETYCSACGTKFEGDVWDRLSETLSEHKPDDKTLALAGLVCSVFGDIVKFSIWHVASTDENVRSLLDKTEKKWVEEHESKAPRTQSLCMVCHIFDCPAHGAYLEDDVYSSSRDQGSHSSRETDRDSSSESSDEAEVNYNIRQVVALPQRLIPKGQEHRCGVFCVDPETPMVDLLGLHKNGEIKGKHNMNKPTELGDPGFADTETCSGSCFWDVSYRPIYSVAEHVRTQPLKRFINWAQKDVDLYRSMLTMCAQIRRGACIMAITVSKPCNMIFEEILLDIHMIQHPVSEEEKNKAQSSLGSLKYGYKDKHYWSEHPQTYDHHKRRPFMPCSHSGPCHKNPDCTCWTSKVACEWFCGCERTCYRRFQGCRCIARGAKVCFKDANCDCWILNRECDPWLCGKCGVLEVLDPVNRHNESILKGRCKNALIQRNIPKRTLKGPSEVHGWGLFAGTEIRANEFIGEYKGEVISEEESNRRGLIYHYRGLEYLFRLNKEQEIDSSRAGNKMRFINNSERPSTINVYAQPMLCNGVQRIGLFAKRNLVAGEEMFFRYGYPESVTKHFWEKEDLLSGKRSGNGDEIDNNTGSHVARVKAKGVKTSVIVTKEKSRKGISKQVKKALHRSGGKERHAHFLEDITNNGSEDLASNPIVPQLYRSKKRKRTSSPVIDETTFDLPENEPNDKTIPSDLEAPAGPSSSSFGARTEVAESDSEDEEYEDDDENVSEDDEDPIAADSESDISIEDDMDVQNIRTTASSLMSLNSSRHSKRSLQTAAARAASLENRKAVKAKQIFSRLGADAGNPTPVQRSGGGGAGEVASTTSTPRSNRSKKTSSSKDSETVRPHRGRKRGRQLGSKKGVHFR